MPPKASEVTELSGAALIEQLKTIDTATIQAEIDRMESDLAELVAAKKKEIDGRRELLRAIEVLQHGRQKRPYNGGGRKKKVEIKAAESVLKSANQPQQQVNSGRKPDRERIANLLRERGAMQLHQIAAQLRIEEGRANSLMSMDPMFECDRNTGRWSCV